jgi:glycosyltransferase involved in cell wall biosynthesis
MINSTSNEVTRLSIIIPCFNEANTIERCVKRVLDIADEQLSLELIIVDDCSTDKSLEIARELEILYPEITVSEHDRNKGKGAALQTGFKIATGDYVAVQDADLEYDPRDLRKLLVPLISDEADVVYGSRFTHSSAHRVLYFWHSLGNKLLTCLSNMFTDLNLTDMETCYKVFRRDIIQSIEIKENRFGFEPEITAKVAHMRVRIFEMGISYRGRTYAEGKKIGYKDALRALYCIFRYNAHRVPIPLQFIIYFFIGGICAVVNLSLFLGLLSAGMSTTVAAPIAFTIAAAANYVLCILLLFRHKAQWNSTLEIIFYIIVVAAVGLVDLGITEWMIHFGKTPMVAKLTATLVVFILNFTGRRFLVFSEDESGPWAPQESIEETK